MIKHIVLIVFPIYLVVAEVFVKLSFLGAHEDPFNIAGPSLTVAAFGLIFPGLLPKKIGESNQNGRKTVILDHGDFRLLMAGWVLFVILAGAWMVCLYLSSKTPAIYWYFLPVPLAIGAITYLAGAVLFELKEKIP